VTRHAKEEMMADSLLLSDIVTSTQKGEVIEDYPDDLPFRSCLIFGENDRREPIHSVWAYDGKKELAILITVYRPDPKRWVAFRTRR
jgi:hypothetical protein